MASAAFAVRLVMVCASQIHEKQSMNGVSMNGVSVDRVSVDRVSVDKASQ
jgi:hypothetical protein